MAEAPSFSTSTRSIRAIGMEFTSTAPLALEMVPIQRLPSTSTSERFTPRPRRSTVAAPAPPPLLTCGLVAAPAMAGVRCRNSPTVAAPELSMF
ncbi:hypothetical protein D9M71_674040 [compost metagenome]